MTTIADRVAAGAAWLDEHRPGWVDRIDLETLDLGDPCRCVLGQEWGEFDNAPEEASGGWGDDAPYYTLGFDVHRASHYFLRTQADVDNELADLTAEWRRYIEARRSPGGTADAFETPAEIAAYEGRPDA